jgi:hypothetical protein
VRIRTPFLIGFLALAAAASGQTPRARMRGGGGTASPGGRYSTTVYFDPAPAALPAPVVGAPYSGAEATESSRTLSDGTRLTQGGVQQRVFRDRQGRTRVERPALRTASTIARSMDVDPIVEITDPVAGVLYVLDVQHRVAYRSFVQTPPQRPAAASTPKRVPARLPPGAESLGTQTIDGVAVEGTRTTRTIPAGTQGLDRDLVITTETWTSAELGITVLRKSNDPRTGESTYRILNLSRADPDIALFLPPPDYLIQDEPGPFSITYSIP